MSMKIIGMIALTLVIVGALNWGLVGLFQFDLVAAIFGGMNSWISRIIYSLIGLSGIYCLSMYSMFGNDDDNRPESKNKQENAKKETKK